MSKKVILLYCYSYRRLNEVILLAKELDNFYEIKILLVAKKDSIKKLEYNNLEYICINIDIKVIKFLLNNSFVRRIKRTSMGMLLHEILFDLKFKKELRYIKELLFNIKYELLITLSDRHLATLEYAVLKNTRDRNIKILIPFLYETDPEGFLSAVYKKANYRIDKESSIYQKVVFKMFKNLSYKEHYIYPAFLYRVFSKNSVLSSNSWVLGAGLSDLTLLGNIKSFTNYKNINASGNYKIVGDISYLNIIRCKDNKDWKNNFFYKYKLENKKLIIYAIGQFMELGLCSSIKHFNIIEENLSYLSNYNKDYIILISLHPCMNYEDYKYLESKYNLRIIDEKLSDVISFADIFVSITSATIVWAALLGIKSLVFANYYSVPTYDKLTSPYVIKDNDIEKKIMYFMNNYMPCFDHDWELLSKKIVFNKNIGIRYNEVIQDLISND